MLLALLLAAAPLPQEDVALHPRAIVAEDGALVEGKYVVVRDGRIAAVADAAPRGVRLLRLDGVLAPGFVDAFSNAGAAGRIGEETARLTPALRAADGADLDAEAWSELAARGVTAVHLVPEPSNVVAGWGALLASGGPSRRVAETTVQVISLTGWIYDQRVGPTALAGGLELLEQAFAAGKEPYARGLLVFVDSAEGMRGARAACERAGIRKRSFALFGDVGAYGGEAAGELVCLPALSSGAGGARQAEVMDRLLGSGTRVAFGSFGGSGEPDALRLAAMLLARASGNPAAAWAAVTHHPAEVLGLADRVGRIAPGARADLVLWSGHPLDAASRVLSTTIGGASVHAASPPAQ